MSADKNELVIPGVTETIGLNNYGRFQGSPIEVTALRASADLIDQGWAVFLPCLPGDKVVAATVGGKPICFIVYRLIEEGPSAVVSLAYTDPAWRQKGVYKALWSRFAEALAASFPELRRIESGYHVDNAASRAMHDSLGEHTSYVYNYYPLKRSR